MLYSYQKDERGISMNTVTEEQIKSFTDEELRELCMAIEAEEKRRRRENRARLIEDFRNAFIALDNAGMYVKYAEGWDDGTYLTKWDEFYFGD